MAKAKFYIPKEQGMTGVMGTLSQTLPDERPITAITVVENSSKCPDGFFPILKTYDEDCDADLWRQPVIFGKKTCRYLCLSKSENVSLLKITALQVISTGETLPSGYSAISVTSDTNKPAWRRKQICCKLTNDQTILNTEAILTDIIVCSRLKKAPAGFKYAGEVNGMLICYKTTSDVYRADNNVSNLNKLISNHNNGFYENLSDADSTPDMKKRAPARPPKESPLVMELNKLNIQNSKVEQISPDYEVLNPAYGLQPVRMAPPAPGAPPVPPRSGQKKNPTNAYTSHTLGNWNGLDGVKFILNPKLTGFSNNYTQNMPIIKKKTLLEINKQYSYNFIAERQT